MLQNVSRRQKAEGRRRRIILAILISIIINLFTPSQYALAGTTVSKEDLISSVSNPANGKIRFNIKAPAETVVYYSINLKISNRSGDLNPITGSYHNTGKTTVTRTITKTVNWYSDKYTITAYYYSGPSKNRTTYKDTDNATTKLVSEAYTDKFVWNDKNISKYVNGQRLMITLTFTTTGIMDLLVTKGLLSGTMATVLSTTLVANDIAGADDIAATKTIRSIPIKGWGYQIKLSPTKSGYKEYLVVYDDHSEIYDTYFLTEVKTSWTTGVIK